MKKSLLGYVVIFLLVAGCESGDLAPIEEPGPDYFPLVTGRFYIYEVDSVSTYFQQETPFHYQVRHVVSDSFKTADGGYAYIVSRSQRANENSPWQPMPPWLARRSEREAIIQEGNIPFVKLAFPLSVNRVWNGNELNNLEGPDNCGTTSFYKCDKYTSTQMDESFDTATGLHFDNTVLVEEGNDPDPITIYDVRTSRYAKEVGLVEREYTRLEFCTSNDDCLGQQQVIQGLHYKATLKEYGQN